MTKWTYKDIEKTGLSIKSTPVGRSKIPVMDPIGLAFIKNQLSSIGVDYVTEHKFLQGRKFRFDVAIPAHKIAIEYEGLNSEKSGHTTLVGFTSNCEKYNHAAIEGWMVLRYTCKNYKDFTNDIQKTKIFQNIFKKVL